MSLPFSNIAISLSGGGYRAAAFHLGVLSMLNEIKASNSAIEETRLIDNIQIISTISGGTITGIMWALYKANGKDFNSCFAKLYRLLNDDELLNLAFDKLKGKKEWNNKNKPANLINAFADVYNEHFFDEEDFSKMMDSQEGISSVIFNATEFKNGLQFRFQNTGVFGNGRINIAKAAIRNVKLGDILAASSCFPMAFEPIIFPDDFVSSKKDALISYWEEKAKGESIALMDGGAVDNQGIESLKKAIDRFEKNGAAIDTVIISDVSGKDIDPFVVENEVGNKSKLTIHKINIIVKIALILSLISIATFLYFSHFNNSLLLKIGMIFFTLIATVSTIFLVFYRKIEKEVSKFGNAIVKTKYNSFSKNLELLKRTPLNTLRHLSKIRLSSTFTLIYGIFMGRIRNIQYDGLYEDNKWKYRTIGNFIYSLKDPKRQDNLPKKWLPIIEEANNMETTLWFNEGENSLKSLILCGQLTICQKLIEAIEKKKRSFDFKKLADNEIDDLDKQLRGLEEFRRKFYANPEWLLELRKREVS